MSEPPELSAYCITFPGSPRAKSFAKANSHLLDCVVVEATDGRMLPESLVRKMFEDGFFSFQMKNRGLAWLKGTAGCFLSHIRAVEEGVASGGEYILIAEDDAEFRRSPFDVVAAARVGGYDLVYLNDRMATGAGSPRNTFDGAVQIARIDAAAMLGTGGEAYLLSRRGALELLGRFSAGLADGCPCGFDGFLQSSAIRRNDRVVKPGGKGLLRWAEIAESAMIVGIALPTIAAHRDGGISLICG